MSPNTDPASVRPLRWRDWLSVGAVDAAAHSMNSLGPFLVGGLIEELHVSTARMGVWSTVEMVSYALAMFWIAPRAGRLSLPLLAAGAAMLAAVAQALSAVIDQYWLLLGLRVATGTGFGLLNTVVNVFAARTTRPDRAISFAMAMQTALYTGMGFVLPEAGRAGGRAGMFLAMAGFVLVLIPFMLLQPRGAPQTIRTASGTPRPSGPAWPSWRRVVPILAAMSLFTFGSLAIWPFTERIGHEVGISRAGFGELTSLSNLLGFVACLVGGWLGTRFGRTVPGIVFLVASGIACALQAAPSSSETFAIAFVANYVLWFLAYPSLIGAACAVDPVGRLPTLCTAVWLLSQAAGTAVAGRFGTIGAFGAIGELGLACCIAAAAIFLFVSIPLDGERRRPARLADRR